MHRQPGGVANGDEQDRNHAAANRGAMVAVLLLAILYAAGLAVHYRCTSARMNQPGERTQE
jgi:hypothetical protein